MARKVSVDRRSVDVPKPLLDEAARVAPGEIRNNLNRLVALSLEEFIARRTEPTFADAMAQMAADAEIQAECAAIRHEFANRRL